MNVDVNSDDAWNSRIPTHAVYCAIVRWLHARVTKAPNWAVVPAILKKTYRSIKPSTRTGLYRAIKLLELKQTAAGSYVLAEKDGIIVPQSKWSDIVSQAILLPNSAANKTELEIFVVAQVRYTLCHCVNCISVFILSCLRCVSFISRRSKLLCVSATDSLESLLTS
jgi:hypothetical protein